MEEPKDGEKLGQDFAGATENEPVETEIREEEGFHHSSENPTTNFEFAEKNPQIPSESCPTAPPDTVKSPPQNPQFPSDSPDRNSVEKELIGSKIDNDEDAGLLDDPEYSLSSEESSDGEVKTENGVEVTNKGASEAAEVTQPTDNCAMEVELKPENPGEIYPVSTEATNQSFSFDAHLGDGSESGTEEEQAAFMKELENFFRERSLEFKPPKFYGEGLNCLKLWRAVTRLGGYDRVTSCKLWRQVGESFKPPKTCTTVSWSFRCFYEKALLVYERHKVQGGELHVAPSPLSEPVGVEAQVGGSQASGSGRARRDAAARAMQGWHSQRLLGNGEVGDPIIKDKSSVSWPKRDKQLKSLSVLKRKKHSSLERAVKVARTKGANPRDGQMASPAVRMDTMVVDVGPAADWVKINVRRTKDCFEVYALVPGLLREEVRVQSDAAGRLVISGEPEQPDNPWGVTPFKKVISLPSRIDAHQTSAVVTLHGQLFVRAPFEQSDL